ncbi:MAG: glycosyltransferase [Saprospiraceae bacterium]|nr:glycosyltransferase [Saprospiraceae bacterium]
MLSILIPIYNYDIGSLVSQLSGQCMDIGIAHEIVCVDDRSEDSWRQKNKFLEGIQNCAYIELNQNIGRSRIRNFLVTKAKYDRLLFLDCDSDIKGKDFIANYINYLDTQEVIFGGREYQTVPPMEEEFLLHYNYGIKRESQIAEYRNQNVYRSFHSNNFLVSKDIIAKFPFDESLSLYGHEDTRWALLLEKNNVMIMHIDNPVIHQGLEDNNIFLRKQSDAIENIIKLKNSGNSIGSKVEEAHVFLKDFHLLAMFTIFYKWTEKRLVRNLLSSRPNLFVLDLFRLGIYCRLMKKQQETHYEKI